MSGCVNRYCEIYRDKKYCAKAKEKDAYGSCDCRHAKYACEVGEHCIFEEMCGSKGIPRINARIDQALRKMVQSHD